MNASPEKISKQAIVIIHGMGEQRPNATLRGFVRCLVKQMTQADPNDEDLDIFDKPDRVSGSYETRRMVIPRNEDIGRPTTHVYEFYWAHHLRDTKWKHILGWLGKLLFRSPNTIPLRLRRIFYTIWGLLLATGIGYFFLSRNPALQHTVKLIGGITWLTALFSALVAFINSSIVSSLGDAARYMSDSPDNIEERQKIRQEGVNLLKDLHESNDYQRIVVASHSLGTVVAYDLLRLLWVEYSETYDRSIAPFDQTALQEIEEAGSALSKLDPKDGQFSVRLNDFRNKQQACWKEQLSAGNKWLITDLVTMGSPLTYMDYLVLGSHAEFQERKKEKEYPVCPPYPDKYKNFLYHREVFLDAPAPDAKAPKLKLLNYSSLYGCIRWTNIYFCTDFIGGPLQGLLGNGIKDVEVPVPGKPQWLPFPFGHTRYWEDKPQTLTAMQAITEALQLNSNPAKGEDFPAQ